MEKHKKTRRFADIVKEGAGFISQIVAESIFLPIADGAERVLENVEDRIMIIEKRILREISSLLIIGLGGIFLIFSLFFYLRESLAWNNTLAFFSIGIVIFVIGLLLKIKE